MQRTYLLQEQLKIIKRELGLEVLLVIIKVGGCVYCSFFIHRKMTKMQFLRSFESVSVDCLCPKLLKM